MPRELLWSVALLLATVGLSFLYAMVMERRLQRDDEFLENLRQGFEKISWEGIPSAPS